MVRWSTARGFALYSGAKRCPPLLPRRGGSTAARPARPAPSVRRRMGSSGRLGSPQGSSLAGEERRSGWQEGPAAALWRFCASGASSSAWRHYGGAVARGEVSRRCRKIELRLGYPLDMVWCCGELNDGDHKRAAPTGHRHAAFGIARGMPETA